MKTGSTLLPDIPLRLSALGSPALLNVEKMGLFCSTRCPGDLILRAYDFARKLRDEGVTVISGFHSPVEKECLRILLRGKQPIIICPARSLTNMRIPYEWRTAIEKERLLLISPFLRSEKRTTSKLAQKRNQLVASMADKVCFIYTTPGGMLNLLAQELRESGKTFVTMP